MEQEDQKRQTNWPRINTSANTAKVRRIIVDEYFGRLFVPYDGPDEPPTFEPEAYRGRK